MVESSRGRRASDELVFARIEPSPGLAPLGRSLPDDEAGRVTMAAYIIVDVEITDPVKYAAYIRIVPPTIARYGGTFLVRGGKAETLEGSWIPKRVVVVEFPS